MSNDEYQHQLTWINIQQVGTDYKIIKDGKIATMHWKDFNDLILKHQGRTLEWRKELDTIIDDKDSNNSI